MANPFLTVFVEIVCDALLGGPGVDVFALHFLDALDCVQGDGVEGAHDAAVLDGPVGADEGEKVGEVGDSETEITLKDRGLAYLEMESMNVEIEIWLTFRTDLPFICEFHAVLADDGEARTIRNIEAGCADDGVAFSFDAVAADDAFLSDGLDGGEVNVDVLFLDCPVEY